MYFEDNGKAMIWGTIPTSTYPSRSMARFFLESGEIDHSYQYIPDATLYNAYMYDSVYYISVSVFRKRDYFGNGDSIFAANFFGSIGSNTAGKGGGRYFYRYPDGRMLLACSYPCQGLLFKPDEHQSPFRILPSGMVDSSFNKISDGNEWGVIPYDDFRLLIYGLFMHYDSVPMLGIARIDTAGHLDTSFHSVFEFPSTVPLGHNFVDDQDRIMVMGELYVMGNDTLFTLLRLLPDGSIDDSFRKIPRYPGESVHALAPTPDGGYLIGGAFSAIHGVPRGRIAKIDSMGNLEEENFAGAGLLHMPTQVDPLEWTIVYNIVYHAQQVHYYVIGRFNQYDGMPVSKIIRFSGLYTSTTSQEQENLPFTLYPNPATGTVNLQLPEHIPGPERIQVAVYNTIGQQVLSQAWPASGQMGIHHFPPGMYFVHLQHEELMFVQQRLVVY